MKAGVWIIRVPMNMPDGNVVRSRVSLHRCGYVDTQMFFGEWMPQFARAMNIDQMKALNCCRTFMCAIAGRVGSYVVNWDTKAFHPALLEPLHEAMGALRDSEHAASPIGEVELSAIRDWVPVVNANIHELLDIDAAGSVVRAKYAEIQCAPAYEPLIHELVTGGGDLSIANFCQRVKVDWQAFCMDVGQRISDVFCGHSHQQWHSRCGSTQ